MTRLRQHALLDAERCDTDTESQIVATIEYTSAMNYEDAIRAVADDTYRTALNAELREMLKACMDIHGSNPVALHRIIHAAEIIRAELQARTTDGQDHAKAGLGMSDVSTNSVVANRPSAAGKWTESRVAQMIQAGLEENQFLEYKAAAALRREPQRMTDMTKDVSAMANAAGGVIVYGIAQSQQPTREHLPERLDPVSRTAFPKEWLEHVLSQIRPRIASLCIHPVQLASGLDDVVYVVEIPKSETAHQARDCRYYRRYNFEAVMMLDHEIRDVMNRRTHPRIQVTARLIFFGKPDPEDGTAGCLLVHIKNESDMLVRYVGIVLRAPFRVQGILIQFLESAFDEGVSGWAYTLQYSNHNRAPLFPQGLLSARFPFRTLKRMEPEPEKQVPQIAYIAYADSMPKLEGAFDLDTIVKFPTSK